MKKCYMVKCIVNMDASHEELVLVKTSKPHLAIQKAESALRNAGFFHVKAFSCKEMTERATQETRRKRRT